MTHSISCKPLAKGCARIPIRYAALRPQDENFAQAIDQLMAALPGEGTGGCSASIWVQ